MRLLTCLIVFLLCSCGDDAAMPKPADYRENYTGTYDCTKSSRGFDDDQFTTDITVEVVLDSLSTNSVIIDGVTIPIDEEGRFELGSIDGDNYDVDLSDDKIRMEINVYFPLGIALPCYIQGEKN